jgi:uncharacterized protein YceH (UPF0502 family)
MPLALAQLEQRIVGVLIEKQMTVPDAYPLTINALVSGCNQKSNRDPQMSVEAYEVEGAIRSLMDKDWVREMDKAGGRAMRYEHVADTQLGVEAEDLALLAELLTRGPQSPGALKTRASRMKPFASPGDVEARLRALADRPVPYVQVLARRSREQQARWMHLLGPQAEPAVDEAEAAETLATVPTPGTAVAPEPAVGPPPVATAPVAWEERIETLELRILELEDRLDRLEGR